MTGLFLIAMAILLGKITGAFLWVPNQKTVKGIVISTDFVYVPDEDRTAKTPTVQYMLNDEAYTVVCQYKSSTVKTGQHLWVSYDQEHPETAIVRPQPTAYLTMAFLIVLGIVEICMSFAG